VTFSRILLINGVKTYQNTLFSLLFAFTLSATLTPKVLNLLFDRIVTPNSNNTGSTRRIYTDDISDRPKTFSAEYLAENYRPNIRPIRIFGKGCQKRKKGFFKLFISKLNIFEKVRMQQIFLVMCFTVYVSGP
jgi:hypothetical protein